MMCHDTSPSLALFRGIRRKHQKESSLAVSRFGVAVVPLAMVSFLRFARLLPVAALAALPVIASTACNAQVATVLSSDGGPDSGAGGGGARCTSDPECNENPAVSALRGRCTNGTCVCNSDVVATANGKCGDPVVDAGPFDCVAKGGLCVGRSIPPPNYRPAKSGEGTCEAGAVCYVLVSTPDAVCSTDAQCNGNSSVSSPWGSCFLGVCMCKEGYSVQPNGLCHTPPPPKCTSQNGTCRQGPDQCLADELIGSVPLNDCGDFVATVCCDKAATCKGPTRAAPGGGPVHVDFECCSKTLGTRPPICENGWQTCPPDSSPIEKGAVCN
jgi:hypothetical protein